MPEHSTRSNHRVPLSITLSVEDYEFAEAILASSDPRARDDFFMAAIHALRQQVDATRHYLEKHGLNSDQRVPPLQYDVVVRVAAH